MVNLCKIIAIPSYNSESNISYLLTEFTHLKYYLDKSNGLIRTKLKCMGCGMSICVCYKSVELSLCEMSDNEYFECWECSSKTLSQEEIEEIEENPEYPFGNVC